MSGSIDPLGALQLSHYDERGNLTDQQRPISGYHASPAAIDLSRPPDAISATADNLTYEQRETPYDYYQASYVYRDIDGVAGSDRTYHGALTATAQSAVQATRYQYHLHEWRTRITPTLLAATRNTAQLVPGVSGLSPSDTSAPDFALCGAPTVLRRLQSWTVSDGADGQPQVSYLYQETLSHYDALGDLLATSKPHALDTPHEPEWWNRFDSDGQPLNDDGFCALASTYDMDGHLLTSSAATPYTDAQGHAQFGVVTTDYEYNTAGQVTQRYDTSTANPAVKANWTQTTYDPAGRTIREVSRTSDNVVASRVDSSYDPLGQLVSRVKQSWNPRLPARWVYDERGDTLASWPEDVQLHDALT